MDVKINSHTPITFATRAEADEHNQRLVEKIARMCSTLEDVDDVAIQLSGHLSHKLSMKFRQMAQDAWFDYNVNRICREFC